MMLAEDESIAAIRRAMTRRPGGKDDLVEEMIRKGLLVETDDRSWTLRSTEGEELMHSRIGALREAFEKFADPSGIAHMDSPRILDLCSGLGYNSLAALVRNRESRIVMLEISPEMIYLGSCLKSPFEEKSIVDRAADDFFSGRQNGRISILIGDARQKLAELAAPPFDIVFHDGFSPANDPALYTVEFLTLLRRHMGGDSILLSYSSSIPFRSALMEAGFHVGTGPSVGRKRGITIAGVNPSDRRLRERLPLNEEMMIALTTTGAPYRDPGLRASGDEINKMRAAERDRMRSECKYIPVKKIKKGKTDPAFRTISEEAGNSREAVKAMNNFLLTKTGI